MMIYLCSPPLFLFFSSPFSIKKQHSTRLSDTLLLNGKHDLLYLKMG